MAGRVHPLDALREPWASKPCDVRAFGLDADWRATRRPARAEDADPRHSFSVDWNADGRCERLSVPRSVAGPLRRSRPSSAVVRRATTGAVRAESVALQSYLLPPDYLSAQKARRRVRAAAGARMAVAAAATPEESPSPSCFLLASETARRPWAPPRSFLPAGADERLPDGWCAAHYDGLARAVEARVEAAADLTSPSSAPTSRFSPRTEGMLAALTAFRFGLQRVEAARRRRNVELGWSPRGDRALDAPTSAPLALHEDRAFSPFPNL